MADERVRIAQSALAEFTRPGEVGELLSQTDRGDGVTTLAFRATLSGYPGWQWAVSVAEIDGAAPTVLETELVPGEGALLAPDWVPWSERLEEYRAAQVAAAAESDDDESDDDADLADVRDDDDDFGDDPDDGIEFEVEVDTDDDDDESDDDDVESDDDDDDGDDDDESDDDDDDESDDDVDDESDDDD